LSESSKSITYYKPFQRDFSHSCALCLGFLLSSTTLSSNSSIVKEVEFNAISNLRMSRSVHDICDEKELKWQTIEPKIGKISFSDHEYDTIRYDIDLRALKS